MPCPHGRQKSRCKDCGGSSFCPHGRLKHQCKECGGSGICPHGRHKAHCKECGGSAICPHGRHKYYCKECGGSAICPHGRRKAQCKECGGSGFCPHGRQKSRCKEPSCLARRQACERAAARLFSANPRPGPAATAAAVQQPAARPPDAAEAAARQLQPEAAEVAAARQVQAMTAKEAAAKVAAEEAAARRLETDGFVEEWHRFELRCVLSHQRLTDPAKGAACTHRAQCNYEVLREYVGRCASGPKQCPIAGCGARLQRTRGVERDETTRALLETVPTDAEALWMRGDEISVAPPPQAVPPQAAGTKRARASGGADGNARSRRKQVVVIS